MDSNNIPTTIFWDDTVPATGPEWADIIARLDLIVMRADALITKIMDHQSEAVTR